MSKGFQIFLWVVVGLVVAAFFGNACQESSGDSGSKREQASAAPRKQLRLSYGFSEGWFMSHDFFLTNASGEDLTEVNLRITFVGEDGSPSVSRYWASWPLGSKQQVALPVERVTNVQRITVSGRAAEGDIDEVLTPQ